MTDWSSVSFTIVRLDAGGWRVVCHGADAADAPVADFVSHDEAREWVAWKSGHPSINPYGAADDVEAPPRLVEVAIEPRSDADREKLGITLSTLAADDPMFAVSIDQASRLIVLKGISEAHLDTKIKALGHASGIAVRVGTPSVAFCERITRRVEVDYTYKRMRGGSGQFARVKLIVEPNEPGAGHVFAARAGDTVPGRYWAGVEKGLVAALDTGVVAACPVVDIRIQLVDGAYHDVDSSAEAFEIAAHAACRDALQKGGPVLIEPIMRLEVVSPEICIAAIVSDLRSRNAEIQEQEFRGRAVVVTAMVPLRSMFGYDDDLRVMSRGSAAFTMRYDHYAPAPPPDDDPTFRPAMGMRVQAAP